MNPHIALLRELGIHIDEAEWHSVHGTAPPAPPSLPSEVPDRPVAYENDVPVFTSTQCEYGNPEDYGYAEYTVVEDENHAHPFVLSWKDEQYYRGNHRPIHRYSRPYRIRWTLEHVLGYAGKLPAELGRELRQEAQRHGSDPLQTRSAHEWVRLQLKRRRRKDLYLSVPFIVGRLGGPRWRVTSSVIVKVYEDAMVLHRTFDALKRQGRIHRQRFPKLQYVLLKLLDRHGAVSPYRVPWARTSIKRRELRAFLRDLTTETEPWLVPPSPPPPHLLDPREARPPPPQAGSE